MKCSISCLVSINGVLEDQWNLRAHIYQFYIDLMVFVGENMVFSLRRDIWPMGRQVAAQENNGMAVTLNSLKLDEVLPA
jgi:hypothetical protein